MTVVAKSGETDTRTAREKADIVLRGGAGEVVNQSGLFDETAQTCKATELYLSVTIGARRGAGSLELPITSYEFGAAVVSRLLAGGEASPSAIANRQRIVTAVEILRGARDHGNFLGKHVAVAYAEVVRTPLLTVAERRELTDKFPVEHSTADTQRVFIQEFAKWGHVRGAAKFNQLSRFIDINFGRSREELRTTYDPGSTAVRAIVGLDGVSNSDKARVLVHALKSGSDLRDRHCFGFLLTPQPEVSRVFVAKLVRHERLFETDLSRREALAAVQDGIATMSDWEIPLVAFDREN